MASSKRTRKKLERYVAEGKPSTALVSNEHVSFREQIAELLRTSLDSGAAEQGRLPSVRQLAAKYGVSLGTVANALAELKKKALLRTLPKKGIYTNEALSVGRGRIRSGKIGVIGQAMGDALRDRMYFEMFNGICEVAAKRGYRAQYLGTRQSGEGQVPEASIPLGTEDVAGIVYILSDAPSPAFLDALRQRNLPCVMTDWFDPALGVDGVVIDNANASSVAVRKLIELGHRRIALVNSMYGQSAAEREAGYRAALKAAGIGFDAALVRAAIPHVLGGFHATKDVLDRSPTAVLCHNDYIAIGALLAAEAAGQQVPDELSVMGFGDHAGPLGRGDLQQLSTVRVDMMAIGRRAAEVLVQRLDGDRAAPKCVRMPAKLVVGDTVARCRSGR